MMSTGRRLCTSNSKSVRLGVVTGPLENGSVGVRVWCGRPVDDQVVICAGLDKRA